MFIHRVSSTDMELVLLISFFLLTANTFGDGTGSDVTRLIVEEDDDAILNCSFGPESIINKLFDWKKQEGKKEVFLYNKGAHYNNGLSHKDQQFKGRVFHFEDQLRSGNASIVIRKTQPGDSGNYTCDFPRDPPSRRASVELIIHKILKDRTSEEIPGASPEPSVTIVNQTNDWALLECSVKGASPLPVVQWRDGAGNILTAEEPEVTENKEKNRFNVILQINVTKSDRYTCVSTQETMDHQISKQIYVHLNRFKVDIKISKETDDGVLVKCEVEGASLQSKVQLKDRSGNVVPAAEPQVTEIGGSYDIILQTTVKKTDYYQCVATQEEGGHPLYDETYVPVPGEQSSGGISTAAVAAIVGTIVVLVGIIVVLVCVIVVSRRGSKNNRGASSQTQPQTPSVQTNGELTQQEASGLIE